MEILNERRNSLSDCFICSNRRNYLFHLWS
nr:MAG TPA: hypothetical protein [Caudoviricetes sp.]